MNGWTLSKGIPKDALVTALVQDATRFSTVHIGLSSSPGYLRSDDGGKSFFAPGKGPGGMTSLVVCPKSPKRLYASLKIGMVTLSGDLGKTWRTTAMRGFPKTERWLGLVGDPSDAGRLYLTQPGDRCLWRSDDSGETWTRMDRGFERTADGAVGFAVTRSGRKIVQLGIRKVAEIGPGEDRWHEIRLPGSGSVFGDPHERDRFWCLDDKGLWRRDSGRSWVVVNRVTKGHELAFDQSPKKRRLILIRESAGVFLSSNEVRIWRDLGGAGLVEAVFAGDGIVASDLHQLFWRKLT